MIEDKKKIKDNAGKKGAADFNKLWQSR